MELRRYSFLVLHDYASSFRLPPSIFAMKRLVIPITKGSRMHPLIWVAL
jgi:hypothetical protein